MIFLGFVGKLLIVEYKDIVWIYEHRLKQHGITTTKSLMAMLKDGKTKALLQVDGITKIALLLFRFFNNFF